MEPISIGVDINGLQDVAAFDLSSDTIVGGQVPSVIILRRGKGDRLEVTAGAEATQSFIGRGWPWPADAVERSKNDKTIRVPLTDVLAGLLDGGSISVGGIPVKAADLYVAAASALSNTQRLTMDGTRKKSPPLVAAIPDDGRFNEDTQQNIVSAASMAGHNINLLWRSVAAILGLADELQPIARRLNGHPVGVLSCLDDGISVNILEIGAMSRNADAPYVVPKRQKSGRFFPLNVPVSGHATSIADRISNDLKIGSEQVLWGDGLPLRWLLNLSEKDALFQTPGGWTRYPGNAPSWLSSPSFDDGLLDQIHAFLGDVRYVVIEGPVLELETGQKKLAFALRDGLRDRCQRDQQSARQTLTFSGQATHLAARGCAEYARRSAAGQVTYLDHLPQIRLAVRDGREARFVPLIPVSAACEGGKEFDEYTDLGFSIPSGASDLEFYILREGSLAPRHAVEVLRTSIKDDTPIQMRIKQTPAQGRAQLTIEPKSSVSPLSALSIKWDSMDVLEGQSEEDIVRVLEDQQVYAPPVQPHPCHAYLWVHKTGSGLLRFSLADHIEILEQSVNSGKDIDPKEISAARLLLCRFQSPYALTRRQGTNRHSDRTISRAVSSDGELPKPVDGLHQESLKAFDNVLEELARKLESNPLNTSQRNQIVTFCAWAFTRCPLTVRRHLYSAAKAGKVSAASNDFDAMGRIFSTPDEYQAYFYILIKHASNGDGTFKQYHIRSLFYLLSLREDAPLYISRQDANELVAFTLHRLKENISHQNYKALMRVCIRALGGLARVRLAHSDFLDPNTTFGKKVIDALSTIVQRCNGIPARAVVGQLARDVLDVIEERGASSNILKWDADSDGDADSNSPTFEDV